MEATGVLVGAVLLCGIIGAAIGSPKGIGGAGLLLGLLFGPLGVLIVAVLKPGKLSQITVRPAGAGWHPDPLGKFDGRYFDGSRWTQHVGRVGADGTRAQFEDVD